MTPQVSERIISLPGSKASALQIQEEVQRRGTSETQRMTVIEAL
jgi:hypothetical protein